MIFELINEIFTNHNHLISSQNLNDREFTHVFEKIVKLVMNIGMELIQKED